MTSTAWASPRPRRAIIEWLEANGHGEAHGHLQAARLAVQPAALLGRAVPDRLRRDRAARSRLPDVDAAGRAARDRRLLAAHASTPTTTYSEPETAARPARASGSTVELDLGDGPKRVPPRDQHDAAVGRLVLVRAALPRPDQRERASSTPRSSGTGWARRRPGDPGGVDLYVGGVEHAVLHLLYARFWHKVLFDLGHVSSSEPFHRLFNQGYIQAAAYTDDRGHLRRRRPRSTSATAAFFYDGEPVTRESGKMGKSLKNAVDARRHLRRLRRRHAAAVRDVDGPARRSRARGRRATSSACTASCSGCGATWSTRTTGELRVVDDAGRRRDPPAAAPHDRRRCAPTWTALRFNTAIAKLIELNNHLTKVAGGGAPRGGRAAGADAGAARAARRRGAVGAARATTDVAGLRAVPESPTRRCWSTTPSSTRCRSTARCGPT